MKFSIPDDKDIAAEVMRIIVSNLEIYDSVDELAKKAGTNTSRLKKIFRKQYGISVFEFSRQTRMEAAKHLLLETNYTLQTIASMVGYSEGNNFQVAFKVVVGCTPGEWRRGKGVMEV